MRVGTGIILSVLSFNVLAAVITNYDSHDPLLVRRTLNPDNKGILWKRANEEQMEPGPSNSGAGIGDGSPNYSSGNRGSSKLKRFREYVKNLYRSFVKNRNARKRKAILKKDKKSIQKAVKKLPRVFKGEYTDGIISRINAVLNNVLKVSRLVVESYDDKDMKPFVLPIPKDKKHRSLTKKTNRMQSTGKKQTKANLQSVTRAIARIAKQPRNVIKEMEKIVKSISRMCQVLDTLYDEYRDLVSKMGFAGTERTIKVTEAHVVGMNMFQFGTSESLDSIKEQINEGLVIFKGKFEGKIQSKSRRH
ncbi:hypothetical protein BASA50_007375 [Batrachochytrium salamandrivorans]|uniref:Uncharacterized protein n=1 Tax=Batrachochytrium salamandrivorans TaxID=1357716 RepID=A0ABQ8F786_9FUNG|nr:hypothetical protein BASA50_007375 [Batrachochytrium salamandrivorans]KAH9256749.1 hypothetical protein BASA81_005043 [Batrachochytrium salamandrivorans]